jgi:LEA14-like dessication related protein
VTGVGESHRAKYVAIAVIVVSLLVAGLIGYSYTQISGQITNVSLSGITFAQLSAGTLVKLAANILTGNLLGIALNLVSSIDLNVQLALKNNGPLPVSIPSETHDLTVNGIDVGTGSANIEETLSPGQTITVPIKQSITTDSIAQIASSVIAAGGNVDVQINGQAHFSLLGLPVSISFQKSTQISLVDKLKQSVESLLSGQANQQQPNQNYNPNPNQMGSVIVSGEYKVSPGKYQDFQFTLSSSTHIVGSFSAAATLGNNIIVYIFDQNGFIQYQSGRSASTYYNSGKVASGTIDVNLSPGTYYIVLDNTYSTLSTKDVVIQVSTS